MMAPNSEP